MKRAAIYARVSTNRQLNGYSIDTQIERCRQYADVHSLKVVSVITDSYSGTKLDRPGLDRLRDIITGGEINAVVIYSQDRLARNLTHFLILREEFNNANIEIHYVDKGLSDDSPETRMNEDITAAFDVYWKEKIVEACRRGKRGKAKSGKVVCSGIPPFGYRFNDDRDMLVEKENEAGVVRMVFSWYAYDRLSIGAITKRLTGLGILTTGDKTTVSKTSKRGHWSTTSVHRMLKSEVYIGVWRYTSGEDTFEVAVPRLVSDSAFEKAQKRLRHNRNFSSKRKYQYLLSGRITCGNCGRAMAGQSYKKKLKDGIKTYRYYRCSNHNRSPSLGECNVNRFDLRAVESTVWNWLCELFTQEDRLRQALEDRRSERESVTNPQCDRLAIVDNLIAENETKQEKLLDAYLLDAIDNELLEERSQSVKKALTSLREERDRLLSEIETIELTEESINDIVALANSVRQGIAKANDNEDFEIKAQIIDILDVQVVLSRDDKDDAFADISCAASSDNVEVVYNPSY